MSKYTKVKTVPVLIQSPRRKGMWGDGDGCFTAVKIAHLYLFSGRLGGLQSPSGGTVEMRLTCTCAGFEPQFCHLLARSTARITDAPQNCPSGCHRVIDVRKNLTIGLAGYHKQSN